MRALLAVMMVLAAVEGFGAGPARAGSGLSFHSAEVVAASDIDVPDPCLEQGTLVLDIELNESGTIESVEGGRNNSCLTDIAIDAIRQWEFAPATLDGNPIASRLTVAVTVRPRGLLTSRTSVLIGPPGGGQSPPQGDFEAAGVTHAAFPSYPGNTVVSGTVVLAVTVGESGRVEGQSVIRDVPPLTADAEAAVGDWRFRPATLDGHTVPSQVVLAFVSRPFVNALPTKNNQRRH